MKVVAKKVQMIAHFTEDGKIKPIRFKIEEEGTFKVIKIENIISTELEKLCGHRMLVFTCNVITDNIKKICEIKFDIENTSWLLFKI